MASKMWLFSLLRRALLMHNVVNIMHIVANVASKGCVPLERLYAPCLLGTLHKWKSIHK